MTPAFRQDFRSLYQNTGKRLLGDSRAREEELRVRLESEGGSDGLTAWQEVAVRGCKTSEGMYEEARKRWEERKELDLPMEEDFSVVCTNLDWALCEAEKQQRGREVRVYEQWREEREELGLSGWWGDWLRKVGEPMEEEEEVGVDWDVVLAPPPVPEWLLKQQRKEELEEWKKARKDATCRRWRNKYAREQREIEEERRKVNEARLETAWRKCTHALKEDRLEEAVKQNKVMFDLARQLGMDLQLTPLTSQKVIMDKLAEQRAAMPKADSAEMQEPMEYPEYPDISLWTDYECFDASSGSEDFDLEEFDYPGRSSKPRKQKPKPQPQSKPTTFSLSCSPPKNLTAPPPPAPKPRPAPRPVEPLPPLPEVPPCAYELIQLENKAEIKAKFLEVFGEPMTKDSFQSVDWARVLGYRLPDGSDDE